MPFANRSDLRTAIRQLLMRPGDTTNLTDAIVNDWITLGEAEIFTDLEDLAECETHNSAFTISAEFTTLPTGFRGFRRAPRVNAASTYRLKLASPTQIDDEYDANSTDTPVLYCIEADKLRVGPVPDTTYTLDITYTARASAITDSTSNFLLDNYPNLYLYGSVRHAAPFIGEDGRIATWNAGYQNLLALIKRSDRRKKWSGNAGEARIAGGTP